MIHFQTMNSKTNYNYNIYTYEQYNFIEHFHKNFEFVYVSSGELEVTINGKSEKLCENDFAIVFPNQVHSFSTPEKSSVWIGVFSEDYIKEFAVTIKGKEGTTMAFKCSESEINYLKSNLLTLEERDVLSFKSSLYMICSRYQKEIELTAANLSYQKLAQSIIKYAEENFQEEISLMELSGKLGYEYHYLSRCFKKIFHTNFKNFINQYRYEHAKNLILKTELPFITIAHESGFGSLRNFNRIYKRFAGITPKEQRETPAKTKRIYPKFK